MAFHGKIALVSGGASGIGQLHALKMAAVGAKVAILDVNESGLKATADSSPNIFPFKCDVTQLDEVEATINQVEKELGPIDRLINCAAIMPGGLLDESKAALVNRIMTINYSGMVNICQTIVPKMLERNEGDVIIYGSTAGIVPTNKFGAYGASKAANNFYAKVLINENKASKVRFQLVCPPAVDTPLIDQAKDNGPDFLKDVQQTRRGMVTPEFVVESVEKCLERGKTINYPGPAKITLLYRFFPRLMEWVINNKL